jgi:hypothetical protein
VGPRESLDVVEDSFLSLLGIETRILSRSTHNPVAISTELLLFLSTSFDSYWSEILRMLSHGLFSFGKN